MANTTKVAIVSCYDGPATIHGEPSAEVVGVVKTVAAAIELLRQRVGAPVHLADYDKTTLVRPGRYVRWELCGKLEWTELYE